jgi:homoserine trans-succinylase
MVVSPRSVCWPAAAALVVAYAAQDRVFAEPIFRVFQQATGTKSGSVRHRGDGERQVVNRLMAESSRPQADL